MVAYTERWNPNIYRGEKIPVLVYSQTNVNARKQNMSPAEVSDVTQAGSEADMVANQLYSGFYMVDGFKITYSMLPVSTAVNSDKPLPPGFTEVFYMKRREWPVPGTG